MTENNSHHLNASVQAEVERLLREANIRKLNNFGWLNADDPDPELIGHAKWQIKPPIDNPMLFNARSTYIPKQPDPPDWLKTIAVAGADFEGLMEAGRMSMGLLLMAIDAARGAEFFFDDVFFDVHRMSALIYLATASERLRELFIAAAFRLKQKKYNKASGIIYDNKTRGHFTSPFIEATDEFAGYNCLSKLIALAPAIVAMRRERNILVHEIATRIAHREQAAHAVQSDLSPIVESFEQIQILRARLRERFAQEHATTIETLSAHYMLLVLASSEIFDFESRVRGLSHVAGLRLAQ
jgi:hypothetical protein